MAPGSGGGRAGNFKGTGWLRFGTARARIFNRMGSDFESPAHPQGRVQHYSDYFNQSAGSTPPVLRCIRDLSMG